MKTWAACTALLALTALAQPALTQATEEAAEEVSAGYLLASKDLDTDYFVAGRNLTIKYTFHNIGDGSAYNVDVTDEAFSADDFELIEGQFTFKIDEVAPRANETVRVVVVPKAPGDYRDQPARFTYQPTEDADVKAGQTSAVGSFSILSKEQYHAQFADHRAAWTLFGVAAALVTAGPLHFAQRLAHQATKSA